MPLQIRRSWLVASLILATASSAAAQNKEITVGAGYQALRFDASSFPRGLQVDVGAGITNHLSMVGEFGWVRESTQQFGLRNVATGIHVAGGGRWDVSLSHRVRPFGQILVGVERDKADIERFGSDSASAFLLQPGGGVAFQIHGGHDLFGEVDLHQTSRDGERTNAVRVVAGLRFHIH